MLDVLLVNDVIQSEPWSHAEKEESNKTCCNQNIPVLPLSDDCSADRPQPFPSTVLCNASGFSYQWMNSSYNIDWYQIVSIIYLPSQWCKAPLIHYSEIKCTRGLVLALDSSRCCSLACGCGYLLMKHSSSALILTEPRAYAEKKKILQKLLKSKHAGLTSFRWPVLLIDHNVFLQLIYATHQGLPISQRTHHTQDTMILL